MTNASGSTLFVCLFHHADRARKAADALAELRGVQGTARLIGEDSTPGPQALADLGVPERDLSHLQDGVRRGGVVLALEAPESESDAIERIFHHYSADKIDEADVPGTERTLNTAAPLSPLAAPAAVSDTAEPLATEAVLPVAEETLLVGKREVDRGGVRVYRHTVEQPVQQDVNLHAERVVLGYREVNRPVTEADLRAGNQQIELVETAEVPVVQKVARVVEEVHVGKVESDRTEVVNDTVRHTEVEVEPVESAGTRGFRD